MTTKDETYSYGWETECGPQSCEYITPQLLKILTTLEGKRVCDLGSGNGALANAIKSAGYYVAGVEYDSQGVEISKKSYPDINFYNLGVEDDSTHLLSREKHPFDIVVSTEVVEHLFSPQKLPIFARNLLPDEGGGYLVVSTPYHGYLKNLALSVFNKWDEHHTALWEGGHIKFWSRRTLTKLLEENGFKVLAFQGSGRLPFIWKSMILIAKAI